LLRDPDTAGRVLRGAPGHVVRLEVIRDGERRSASLVVP